MGSLWSLKIASEQKWHSKTLKGDNTTITQCTWNCLKDTFLFFSYSDLHQDPWVFSSWEGYRNQGPPHPWIHWEIYGGGDLQFYKTLPSFQCSTAQPFVFTNRSCYYVHNVHANRIWATFQLIQVPISIPTHPPISLNCWLLGSPPPATSHPRHLLAC